MSDSTRLFRPMAAIGAAVVIFQCLVPALSAAPVITATKNDGVSATTKKAAGSTLTYTTTLTNTGDAPGTGISFTDPDVANAALTGAVRITPIARDDAYSTVGNTQLVVNAPNGVLFNDSDSDGAVVTVKAGSIVRVSGTGTTNSTPGTLVVSADGAFTYTPGVGAVGTERFQYTAKDADNLDCVVPGFVDFTISGRVWYVQAGAAGAKTGRSHEPFDSPSAASTAADAATDIIYVLANGSALNGAFTLENGQQLLGQGGNLTVGGLTPFTATTAPVLTNTGGNTVTLAGSNTISGVVLGNRSGAAITGSGFGTLTVTSDVIINGTGQALNLNTGTLAATFATLSASSATNGINLVAIGGTLTINGGALATLSGDDFVINGGTVAVTSKITINNTAGRSVNISGKTASGNVVFNGTITDTGTGILLDNNDGATITLKCVKLTTAANTAFSVINGGTVVVTNGLTDGIDNDGDLATDEADEANTIATTTGTALNINATNIGAGGMTFRSIASNGAANGIVLNTTGSSGGLTVTGDGGGTSNGSGGIIQNSTGTGISLTSASNVNLGYMTVQNSGDDGINAGTVSGFTLNRSNVTTNGNSVTDEGIEMDNVSGTVSITNTSVTGSAHNNLYLDNFNTNLASLAISGSTFNSNALATGNHGVLMEIRGTSVLTTATFSGNTVSNNVSIGLQVTTADTSTISAFTLSGCTFQDTGTGNTQEIAMDFSRAQTSNLTVSVLNNLNITGHNSQAMNFFSAAGAGTTGIYNARIEGNIIGNNSVAGSGSVLGNGMRVNMNGDSTNRIIINNNQVYETPNGRGIEVIGRNGVGNSDVTITNNTVDHTHPGFAPGGGANSPLAAIFVQSNTVTIAGQTVRADIRGNTVSGFGQSSDLLSTYINVIETGATTLQLVDSPPASADATSQLTSTNTGGASANAGVTLIAGPINLPPLLLAQGGVERAQSLDPVAPAPAGIDAAEMVPALEISNVGPSSESPPAATDGAVSQMELDAVVAAAVERWKATGLTTGQLARLQGMSFEVASLGRNHLGEAGANTIRVDRSAGGNGWFVHADTGSDALFGSVKSDTRRYTDPTGAPAGRVDLLTTIMHEMGHALGLSDSYQLPDRNNIMYGHLTLGERRLPAADQAMGAKSFEGNVTHFLSGAINIAGNLPPGKAVAISYTVTIADPLPLGALPLSSQGIVSGNFTDVLTDDAQSDPADPVLPGIADPTITLLDRPDTTVVSLDRTGTTPTNASPVTWQIVFANPVIQLTSGNFSLVNTGLGGAPALSGAPAPVGPLPATTWNITATTGTGDGTLGLNLVNDTAFSHDVTNLTFTGQVYSIDKTPPSVSSVVRVNANPSKAASVNFTVTFSENVTGVDVSDFTTPTTGTAGGTISGVSGSGAVYTVTVAGLTGDGTLGLNVNGSGTNIADSATNGLSGGFTTGETYSLDHSQPTVAMSSATAEPTINAAIPVTVQFSETVTGFASSDITASNASVGNFIAVDGDTFTFELTPSGPGVTAIANIAAAVAQDGAGNDNTAATQFSRTIIAAPTTTTLASSVNPSVFGQSVTFTATVSCASGTPDGTVSFKDGATEIGTGTLNASGITTFTTTGLGLGSHSITAVYAGTVAYATSTSNVVSQQVNKISTTSVLASNVNPATSGQSVTFTATLAAVAPGAGVPTGTVQFFDGAASLGSVPLSAGSGALTTASLALGSHSITAIYAGDSSFETSTSNAVSQLIANPPVITSPTVASLTSTGATLGGNVTSAEGSAITERGVVYSATTTNANPQIGGTGVIKVTSAGTTGVFTVNASLLASGANYSFAAYAINARGTSYTAPVSTFTTLVPPTISTAFGSVVVGQFATTSVTYTVTNPNGSAALTGVAFTDLLPQGFTVATPNGLTGNAGGTVTAVAGENSVSLTGGTLAAGASATITVNITGSSLGVKKANYLTVTSTEAPADISTLTFARQILSGALVAGDSEQTGRMNRFGVASTIAAPKAYPGTFITTGQRSYDAYTFTNTTGQPQGMQVWYMGDGSSNTVFSAAYTGSFNPVSLGTNYLADPGSSPTTAPLSYSFTIPAGTTVVVIVHMTNAGTSTPFYALGINTPFPANLASLASLPTIEVIEKSISIAADSASKAEGTGAGTTPFTFTVSRTGATTGPVTLDYAVSGAAVNAADFGGTLPSVTVTIPDGSASTTLTVNVSKDSLVESNEAFTVTLSNPNNGYVLNTPAASSTITNDDTATTLASNTNPSVTGQTVTLTATVNAGGGTATGTVAFKEGTTAIGSATLVAGQATLTTTSLAAGNHDIAATYNGDVIFGTSVSSTLTQTVNPAATATTLAATPISSTFGQSVTLTATVTVNAPGTGAPTGTVTFIDNSITLGTGIVNGSGVASLTTTALGLGSRVLTAVYAGDANYAGSTSVNVPGEYYDVNSASTSTSMVTNTNPVVFGQSVTFTATVAVVAPGAGTPTGFVKFNEGVTLLGLVRLTSDQSSLTTSSLAAGTHTIKATYQGNGFFGPSISGDLIQVVNKANTTTALVSSGSPTEPGQGVTFTATVGTVAPGAGTATGTITFMDGAAPLSTVPLNAGGVATLNTSTLTTATHTITAVYNGDANFNTSTSGTFSQIVGPKVVTINSGSNQSATVNTAFANPLQVRVVNAANTPLAGITVTFTAPGAGASGVFTGGISAVTNGSGIATAPGFTANTIPGSYTVAASVPGGGGPANFTLSNLPGAATHLLITAPASTTAGVALSYTVAAKDAFENTATAYAGTVHFTGTDGAATLSADSTLTNGTGTFSATLRTAGNRTIAATDTVTSSIAGTSGNIAVSAAAATHFTVSSPPTITAGVAFNSTVTALDAFNNTATAYSGTVHFTSSDISATLPANSSLINGAGTFPATLRTAGLRTITATDTVTSSITGTSGSITVSPAAATTFTFLLPSKNAIAGEPFLLTVTAIDSFGNTASGYLGTVHLTSSDPASILPVDSTFTAGVKSFSIIFATGGDQTVTFTDTVNPAITNSTSAIVSPRADLAITLTDSPDPVNALGNLTYTITLTNNGPSTAVSPAVSLPLPASTTFVSSTAPATWGTTAPAPGGIGMVNFSNVSLASGGSATFTVVAKVDINVVNDSILAATATASSITTDPVPGNNSATTTTLAKSGADLQLTLVDSPDPVIAGTELTYTLQVANNGPLDAETVSISDVLPAGTTFVSLSAPGGWLKNTPAVDSTGAITITNPLFANADTATFTLVVKVGSNVANGTILSNTAAVSSTTIDIAPGNNAATTTTTVDTRSDLVIDVAATPVTAPKGSDVTYAITLTNNGPSDASAPAVSFPIPAQMTFVSAITAGGWSPTTPAVGGTGNVGFSAGSLATGTTVSFTVVAKVNANAPTGTVIVATATASATGVDPVPASNTDSATAAVGTVNLSAVQPITTGIAVNSQTGLFNVTVTVTNTTPLPINGFRLHVDYSAYKAAYPSLRLYNASSPVGASDVYIDYPFPVAVDSLVSLKLSFYTSTRTFPSPFKPILTVDILPTSQVADTNGSGVQPRLVMLPDTTVLLEFPSTVGRWYRVRYSSDLVHWQDCPVPLQAGTTRMQWIDSGPPFTDVPPAQAPSRYYRVNEIAAP